MRTHQPPQSSYIAGGVTRDEDGVLVLDKDSGKFQARLMLLKVENRTDPEEELDIKLEVMNQNSKRSTCVEAPIPGGQWEVDRQTGCHGAWAVVAGDTTQVKVSARDRQKGAWQELGHIGVRAVGHRVSFVPTGTSAASSEEFRHVYYQGHAMVVQIAGPDGGEGTTKYGWVRWTNGTEERDLESSPHACPPGESTTIDLDPSVSGPGAGWVPVAICFGDRPDRVSHDHRFELFDVDGNTARILVEHDRTLEEDVITSGPYAVTAYPAMSAGTVNVVNDTSEDIDVWPMGNPSDGRRAVEANGGSRSFGVGEGAAVPYTPPLSSGDTRTRQAALHWKAGGDPKIVIKQDNCGDL